MLGPAIYLARLPLLEPQVFVDKVVSRSLLSEEEKVDVMRHFLVPAMRSVHFKSDLRKKQKHRRFNRFDTRNPLAWNNKSGESAISFMVSHSGRQSEIIIITTTDICGTTSPTNT